VTLEDKMTDRLLDIEIVANLLNIQPRTLRAWIREGKSPIPLCRLGKRVWRAKASDVERLIQNWEQNVHEGAEPPVLQPNTDAA